MLVVNLFGGPGSGKSTLAAGTFAWLKTRTAFRIELVTEFAKELTWAGYHSELVWQPRILGEQSWRLARLQGKVDVVITDSPVLLGCIYNRMLPEPFPGYEALAWDIHKRFRNFDVRVRRGAAYDPNGRNQNEEEARRIDADIDELLSWAHGVRAPDAELDGHLPTSPAILGERVRAEVRAMLQGEQR